MRYEIILNPRITIKPDREKDMTTEDTTGPYQSEKEKFYSRMRTEPKYDQVTLDPESLKHYYDSQRSAALESDGQYSQKFADGFKKTLEASYTSPVKKLKVLTTKKAPTLAEFEKKIIYCPICGPSAAVKMTAHTLQELLDKGLKKVYIDLVGGLPFADDTVFVHCSSCNVRLLAEMDDVEKLDEHAEKEYKMTSLNSPSKINSTPVIVGQKGRMNLKRDKEQETIAKRRRAAMEAMDRIGQP